MRIYYYGYDNNKIFHIKLLSDDEQSAVVLNAQLSKFCHLNVSVIR